jgi:hypothetical protein
MAHAYPFCAHPQTSSGLKGFKDYRDEYRSGFFGFEVNPINPDLH